ncbi:MAG: YCF48-related protein [Phycisphaerales bacterium]|nr:YCF48-related protein [Phycisphaerales bacterium]
MTIYICSCQKSTNASLSGISPDLLAITDNDYYFISNDQGTTWNTYSLNTKLIHKDTESAVSVQFFDNMNGMMLTQVISPNGTQPNSGYVYRTRDGGISWRTTTNLSTPIYPFLMSFNPTDINRGVISALFLFVFELRLTTADTGNTWTAINQKTGFSIPSALYTLRSGNILKGRIQLSLTGPSTGFIELSNDGGATFSTELTTNNIQIRGFSFANDVVGWAVGDSGYVYKTTDGGLDWAPQSQSLTDSTLNAVYFINDQVGYAAGAGTIIKTNNSGSSWISTYSNPNAVFNDIYATSNYVFAVGYNMQSGVQTPLVLVSKDDGNSWVANTSLSNLTSIKINQITPIGVKQYIGN